MLLVPGYVVGASLGHAEPPRIFAGTAEVDGRPVVLRRSTASGVVARDALRTAVARVAGVQSGHLIVPSAVVTTIEGLVVVYDASVAAVWDGVADFADPAAAVTAVVTAVVDLHDAGLAHGALVPEAVWLDADGRVRLACLPGPEEADMSADRKNLSRFSSRIAIGHAGVGDAVAAAGDSPAPRDLLSRLAPFAIPVTPFAPAAEPSPPVAPVPPVVTQVLPVVNQVLPPPVAPVPPVPVAPVVTAPHPRPASAAPQERDVLRAPRPNRPIAGPAVQRATLRSRLSRPAVVAVVGVSVLLGAAGIGVAAAQLTRQTPATLPPLAHSVSTTPAATATTPAPTAAATTPAPLPLASGDAAWVAVMTQLDRVRDAAFVAADPTALDRVYVDGSSAGTADRAAMSKLRDTGVRADGLALVVHEVRLVHRKGDRVVLNVVDDLPPYRLVGEHGDTVRTEPARATASWRITLEMAPGGWRISTIERAASSN